jgi:hypothetical protein
MFRIDELKNGPAFYPSRVCQKAGRGRQRTRRSEAPKPQGNGVDGGAPSQGVAPLGGWRREMHRPGVNSSGRWLVTAGPRPIIGARCSTRLAAPGGSKAVEAGPPSGAGDGDALGVAPMAFATRLASIRRQRGSYRIWYMALTPATLCGKV